MVLQDYRDLPPFELIAMDVGSMPTSPQGNCCFLMVVDMSTKLCSMIALPHQQAPLIRAALWKCWFGNFGVPKRLLSDQGENMDGNVIRDLCKELGIKIISLSSGGQRVSRESYRYSEVQVKCSV